MQPRSWHAVDIAIGQPATEAVESAFNVLDSLGTEVDSLGKAPDEPVVVTGFFDDKPSEDEVRAAVEDSLRVYDVPSDPPFSVSFRCVEETDWLAEWKRHWTPQDAGRFRIAPPWFEVEESDQILVRIEPNMAFGTGTHETTRLCLEAISELYTGNKSFLDVGTGTGILAIAAAKLGGSSIRAFDTDHDSVAIAKENADANQVGDRIGFLEGPLTVDIKAHDFVCANLTLDLILPILSLLVEKTNERLILSGILAEQEEVAAAAVKKLVKDIRIERDREWIAIIASPDRRA